MQLRTVWEAGSSEAENSKNLETIRQWWLTLDQKEVTWIQRLIPQIGGMEEIHWQLQRFDESFVIVKPDIRETSLYWYKEDSPVERSLMPQKLEFDYLKQHLYIYPHSQEELVIRVGRPDIKYQTIELKNPEIEVGKDQSLLIWDAEQQLEIKVNLNSESLKQLRKLLAGEDR